LEELEQQEKNLDKRVLRLDEEEKKLVQQENKYWENENKFEYKLKNYLEDNAQMKNQWKSKLYSLNMLFIVFYHFLMSF